MRRDKAAEWILSRVTSPERAASIVGDLVEDGPAYGVRFWLRVFSTTASLTPQRIAQGSTGTVGKVLGAISEGCMFPYASWLPVDLYHALATGGPWSERGAILACMTGEFLLGWWLAQRVPGRGLAACWMVWIIPASTGSGVLLAPSFMRETRC
jgi:hypothetical protein